MEETLPSRRKMEWVKEISVGYTKIKKKECFTSSENISNKTVIIDPAPIRLGYLLWRWKWRNAFIPLVRMIMYI
jgi:hypothetical protein